MTGDAVVLVSGGMDSATAAAEADARGYDLHFLHTSYGQRTQDREYDCARRLADHYDATFEQVDVDHLAAIGGSSLTDESMPVGDADDADGVPDTYVPFRNANLLSIAVAYAEANDCEAVVIGVHSEDYAGYPDCRPAFIDAFQRAVDEGTKPATDVEILAPFVEWRKTDIVERGVDLDVPYEHTWSCYRSDAPACGTCDSCAYRLEAFRNAGVRDPIEYETRPSSDAR